MSGALDIEAGAAMVLASQAEAEAGSNHTKAMTPLRVAQAIAALSGGGGEAVALPLWAWVETVANGGSDAEGAAGNPGKPFATVSAAIGAGARMLCLGAGTFAGATVSIADLDVCFLGTGCERTTVTTLRNKGQAMRVRDAGVHSVQFGTISTRPDDAAAGAPGTSAGNLVLQNVRCENVVCDGGRGGDAAGSVGDGLDGGHAGALTVEGQVRVGTVISACGGDGGSPAWDREDPESGANGGAGGNGGGMQGMGGLWAETVSLAGGNGSAHGGNGSDGAGGNGGDVMELRHFRIGTLDVSGKGTEGEAGDVRGCHFGQIGELQQMGGEYGNGGALRDCSFLHIDAMWQNGSTGGGLPGCAYLFIGAVGSLGSDGAGNPPMSFLAGNVNLGGA